jgi:PKD repeat protein
MFQLLIFDSTQNADVQFVDSTVDPENVPLSSWLWDFGDGYTSDLQSPTHKFASNGDYNVTLTVRDDENAASTFSMPMSVTDTPPPEVPVAVPLWIVALIIAIFATLGISLVYLRRRKTPRP